jgi:hypothetical protein
MKAYYDFTIPAFRRHITHDTYVTYVHTHAQWVHQKYMSFILAANTVIAAVHYVYQSVQTFSCDSFPFQEMFDKISQVETLIILVCLNQLARTISHTKLNNLSFVMAVQ